MRIHTLHLERYGCFTDVTLHLRPGACLHVILGANEAGKSTALSAVEDLLFGFKGRTPYDFQHASNKLLIGAELSADDGSTLTFKRRKGNTKTLLNPDGSVLPDTALVPFLGPMDRKVFVHAFGLSQESLRTGAEEMLQSSGEAGTSLLAAASGLRGLTALRKKLESDASNIFARSRANHRVFYQAYDRFDAAHQQVRSLELRANQLRKHERDIQDAEAALASVRKERAAAALRGEQVKRQRDLGCIDISGKV